MDLKGDPASIAEEVVRRVVAMRKEHAEAAATELRVAIEDSLKSFVWGSFSSRSMLKLLELNSLVRYLLKRDAGLVPELVHPTVGRKMYGLNTAVGAR